MFVTSFARRLAAGCQNTSPPSKHLQGERQHIRRSPALSKASRRGAFNRVNRTFDFQRAFLDRAACPRLRSQVENDGAVRNALAPRGGAGSTDRRNHRRVTPRRAESRIAVRQAGRKAGSASGPARPRSPIVSRRRSADARSLVAGAIAIPLVSRNRRRGMAIASPYSLTSCSIKRPFVSQGERRTFPRPIEDCCP